jgi:hypothetical protein
VQAADLHQAMQAEMQTSLQAEVRPVQASLQAEVQALLRHWYVD